MPSPTSTTVALMLYALWQLTSHHVGAVQSNITSEASLNSATPSVVTSTEKLCHPSTCQLPDCRCVGSDIPGNLSPQDVPQMVLLTMDDEISHANYKYYQGLFPDELEAAVKNPNGCRAPATLFICDWTNMTLAKRMVERGNEVASHSITHSLSYQYSWTAQQWDDEIQGMREMLATGTGLSIAEIRGMRSPHLQLGGDTQYSMLERRGFLYDSSMFGGAFEDHSSPPLWPFTLDYPPYLPIPGIVCDQSDCPTQSHPKLWEVPLVRHYTPSGQACSMTDSCPFEKNAKKTQIIEYLRYNFLRHYTHNRAPFIISVHAKWFMRVPASYDALKEFLHEISLKSDVWRVTMVQMLDWVRHPRPLSGVHEIPSWQCSKKSSQTPKITGGLVFVIVTITVLFSVTIIILGILEWRNAHSTKTGSKRPKTSNYNSLPSEDPQISLEEAN